MVKITDGDDLNVGVEITIDTTARTFTLIEAGNLIAKDGVTLQALYSKFIKLWETSAYNKFPFPMYAIDAKSGQFQFGTDGGSFNGWAPADDVTRQMHRDGGWSEFSAASDLLRQHVGAVSLGEVSDGAQLYYQREANGAAIDFTFTDEVNEGVQIYGDATNGNFDTRVFFKAFVREQGFKYKSSTLADTAQTATGASTLNVLLSNEDDLKITDTDANVATILPYTAVTVEYFGVDQTTYDIGAFPFRVIVDNTAANATLEEIYTKIQYLLRQNIDIDEGLSGVMGKTADELCFFVGDTLYTTRGVFIDGVIAADLNRVVFLDQNELERLYAFTSAGALNFNNFLAAGAAGYYIMYFANDDAGDDLGADYATATAEVVNDATGTPIQGTISAGSLNFTYDFDGNVQRGATSFGTDAPVIVVAGNKGVAKPVVATGTISRSKSNNVTLVAEQDRAYVA